ncbi:MAG: hypothetical protein H6627_14090 [Calditrichae bacterium]|nr:hypothetical protein [Calditrichia bacterium]
MTYFNFLFYLVFASQVFLVSFYYPNRILERTRQVVAKFPPQSHPKLYPKPLEYYAKAQRNYRMINGLIFLIGLILLGTVISWDYNSGVNQKHAEAMPLFYGIVQFFPFILLELSGFKQFKLMREADKRTTRKATLQPRRLFDFISPIYIWLALITFLSYVLFELYMPDLRFHWDSDALIRISSLVVCNLLFAAIILWNIYGKKLDPYQASKDRIRQTEFTFKSLVFTSMAVSLFFIATIIVDEFGFDKIEIIINSLYFQLVALLGAGTMLRNLRIENIDFDVYKEDAATTKA